MAVFKVKRALWIAGCCLVAISVVLTLTAASGILREGRNSFLRSLPPHPVFEGRSLDLGYNSYYIAGTADAHVYLGNSTSPLHMVVANATLEDTTHVTIAVNGLENQKFWSLRVLVDSPYFYLYDGAVPRIYAGNVNDWVARRIEHDSIFFLDMRPIGSSSFWIKSIRSNGERSVMGKVTGEKPFYEFNEDILESQVDGVFCVDGTMVAQAELNRLVYLYYYRNEYLVLDTNLNILQRGRTIDTTNRAKIRVDVDPMKNVRQFAGPPLLVNRSFAMFQDLAFVSSNLMSQNDHERVFDHASIMDVYDVGAGRYLLSFYVYHYGREEKMRGFAFSGRKMIVLFDRHVESFELNNQYFRSIDKHSRVKTGL